MRLAIIIGLSVIASFGANLLVNPGFEKGLAGWQTTGMASFKMCSDTFQSGTGSAAIAVSTPDYQRIYQDVPGVFPDNVYSASCYVRTIGISTASNAYMFLEFLDAGGYRISDFYKNLRSNHDTGWTYLHMDSAKAPSNAVTVRVGVALNEKGMAYYDDATLTLLKQGEYLPATVTVDMDTVVQDDFLGVNAVYHGFAFMPEELKRGMNDADRAREFGRVEAMKLNIARTWYRPDWACSTNISAPFNWNSVKMRAFYSWLQAMKERNVDVALNLGWWLYFKKDAEHSDARWNLSDENIVRDTARFAEWVSASIREMVINRKFTNIKYGILFTEPSSYGDIPTGFAGRWDYYKLAVKAIHNRLVHDGLRNLIKLVGPNNTGAAKDIDRAAMELNNEIDIFSGHEYNYMDYESWFTLGWKMQLKTRGTGKKIWLDEYGRMNERYRQTGDYGNYIAQVVAASMNAGLQTSTIWLLFDQLYVSPIEHGTSDDSFYDGVHRWGTCRWPHDATMTNPTLPYPHYYAFSMMSRLLPGRDSTKVVKTTNSQGVVVSALRTRSGGVSFLLINKNSIAKPCQLSIKPALSNRIFYKYVYDPAIIQPTEAATPIAHSATITNVQAMIQDTLPVRGVVILSTINTEASDKTSLYKKPK